ncbi:hypothetical protein GCM10027417_18280 [Glutamicibacter endophyticus]
MTRTLETPRWRVDPTLSAAAARATDLLADAGIHADITDVQPPAFNGRNGAWSMGLTSGQRIFVKHILAEVSGDRAFERSVAFAEFSQRHSALAPHSPQLIAHRKADGLLIFEHCGGINLAELLIREAIPEDFAAQAGRHMARLHRAPIDGLAASYHPSPPTQMLRHGVSQERYVRFTLAELALWPQLQEDQALVTAAEELRAWEAAHQVAPIHGDLRLDQFHLSDGRPVLLDWEEFGLGDPARDLGTFAGEWIYRAVLDTVTSRGGAGAPPLSFDAASATRRITERMEHLAPRISQMWQAYRLEAKREDPELALRATAHLGWHLVDRTIARAATVSRLPGIERAAAGIGRKILLAPAAYRAALGF